MRAVYQCIYALVITIIMNEMKDISDKIKLFDWKYINKNPFPFRYYIMMMIIYTSFTYHILYSLCPAVNMKLYIEYFDIFCAWWITSPPRLENNILFARKSYFDHICSHSLMNIINYIYTWTMRAAYTYRYVMNWDSFYIHL